MLLVGQEMNTSANLPEILKYQLKESSFPSFQYQKIIYDLTQRPVKPESHSFIADTLNKQILTETDYALTYYAASPKLSDYFTKSISQDTLIYTIKQEFEAKCPLKTQKILKNRANRIVYWESEHNTSSFLYHKEICIRLYFDEQGKYSHHFLKAYVELKVIQQIFHTLIIGERK